MTLIARFDLDKTYLRSDFETLSDLAKSAFERADQKRPVPGATELLHELSAEGAFLHVLSGSPEQLRSTITARLRLDGIALNKLTLKPSLQNLLRLRFRSIKDQLAYKLLALLEASDEEAISRIEPGFELLVGDDSETDALVYSLYSDIREGILESDELARVLSRARLYRDELEQILELARRRFATAQPRERLILIHLAHQTAPSEFDAYGPRLGAFFNYAQAAFILLDRGLLTRAAAVRVAASFTQLHRFDSSALARSYWDLGRRGLISERALQILEAGRDGSKQETWIDEALMLSKSEQYGTDVRRFDADYKFLAGRHRTRQNRP